MKQPRLRAIALCFIVIIMPCLTLVSCFGASPPDGYLAADAQHAAFIQFTEKNNRLNGHLQEVLATNSLPPQTQAFTLAFTGPHNGSSVTITFSGILYSSSVTGTFSDNTLTLAIPQQDGHLTNETFQGASVQQYNQAVDILQRRVSQQDQQYADQQATATQQYNESQATATAIQSTQIAQQNEQQAVRNANWNLGNALSALKSDENGLTSFSETSTLQGYASDWRAMQQDYVIEQKDAQQGCSTGNYGQVQADAHQVDADENQILADDNQLSADKNQYDTAVSAVQNDMQAVKQDWSQLQQAVASNTTNTPPPAYTSEDINKALQEAQNAEKTAQSVRQSAQSNAAQYDLEANALQQKADALPASMHCT
jgi:hypothetical protein